MADTLTQFTKLHAALINEKQELEARLTLVNQALSGEIKAPRKQRKKRKVSAATKKKMAAATKKRGSSTKKKSTKKK